MSLRYYPDKDTWSTLAPMPLPVSGGHAAVYADRYAVVAATDDISSDGHTDVWFDLVLLYELKEDRWMRIRNALPTGGVLGDTLYVACGEGPQVTSPTWANYAPQPSGQAA
jgi:hypothetical protein